MNEANTLAPYSRKAVLSLVLSALLAALTAALSQVVIPVPWGVPYNLGLMGVYLAGGLLGWKRGTVGITVYVALGAVGLPVFSGARGGFAALFGPTGGYIFGYILTALAIGLAADRLGRSPKVLIPAMAAATLLTYLPGTLWFVYFSGGKHTFIGALALCVVPYLAGDAAKIVLSALLSDRLYRMVPTLRR